MHPVLKRIFARKNKKIPVKDHRKIALVMLGGAMAAIRGMAAGAALEELGLAHVFDEIYCASAGFCNASCMLVQGSKAGCSVYYRDLPRLKFINLKRFWKIVDIEIVVKSMSLIESLESSKVFRSKTKLFIRLYNKTRRKKELVELHEFDPEEYLHLFRAAISIPYFSPGTISIRGQKYMDAGFADADVTELIESALNSSATDVLIIYNFAGQRILKIPQSHRVCEIIPPAAWTTSRFEMRPDVLKSTATDMGKLIKTAFGQKPVFDLSIAGK